MVSVCAEGSERGRLDACLPPLAGEPQHGVDLRNPACAWGGGGARNPAPGERGSRGWLCRGHACAVAGVAGPEVRGWRRLGGLLLRSSPAAWRLAAPFGPFSPEKVNRGVNQPNNELIVCKLKWSIKHG